MINESEVYWFPFPFILNDCTESGHKWAKFCQMSSERGKKKNKHKNAVTTSCAKRKTSAYQVLLQSISLVVCCTWTKLPWQTQPTWDRQQMKPWSLLLTFRPRREQCLTSSIARCRYPVIKDNHSFSRAESNPTSGCKIQGCSQTWWMLKSCLWEE